MRPDNNAREIMLAAVPSLRAFAISLCGNVERADGAGSVAAGAGEPRFFRAVVSSDVSSVMRRSCTLPHQFT